MQVLHRSRRDDRLAVTVHLNGVGGALALAPCAAGDTRSLDEPNRPLGFPRGVFVSVMKIP